MFPIASPRRLVPIFVALALLPAAPAPAQQRSIQLEIDITKTFEAVERNRSGFDAAVIPARKQLEALAKRSAEISRDMSGMPSGLSEDQRQRRRQELHAEAVQLHAEYLKQASTVVTEASKLIAGNMSALDGLARRMEQAGGNLPDLKEIEARIESQTEVGRQIMREINTIRELAAHDPAFARRLNSLIVTASAIDRGITAQKLRVQANRLDGLTADNSRVVGMIRIAVNELADMYTGLEADKALLGELREEVELALNLGLLDLTRKIVQQSLPTLTDATGDSVVPGLSDMISGLRDQNRNVLRPELNPSPAAEGPRTVAPRDIPVFKNF